MPSSLRPVLLLAALSALASPSAGQEEVILGGVRFTYLGTEAVEGGTRYVYGIDEIEESNRPGGDGATVTADLLAWSLNLCGDVAVVGFLPEPDGVNVVSAGSRRTALRINQDSGFGLGSDYDGDGTAAGDSLVFRIEVEGTPPDDLVRLKATTSDGDPGGNLTEREGVIRGPLGVQCEDAPLPVEVTAFRARTDGGDVLLDWTTLSETANAGFALERAAAGEPFEAVAWLPGAGTTAAPQRYAWRDADVPPGRHHYRLRQVDVDGRATYVGGLEVTVRPAAALEVGPASPNPFATRTAFRVRVQHPGRVRVEVFDVAGRRVALLHDGPVDAAGVGLHLDAGALPGGAYLVRATGPGTVATRLVTLVGR